MHAYFSNPQGNPPVLVTQHHALSVHFKVIIACLDISLCLHRHTVIRHLLASQPQELLCVYIWHRTHGTNTDCGTEIAFLSRLPEAAWSYAPAPWPPLSAGRSTLP